MTILLLISRRKVLMATQFPLLAKEPMLTLCGSVFARLSRENKRTKSRTCSCRGEHETDWAGIAAEGMIVLGQTPSCTIVQCALARHRGLV